MGIFMNRRDAADWFNQQQTANQQTNLQQMVYEQSQLIGALIEEVKLLRNALVESNMRGDK
ncbi:hypothetical protein [uncultured Rothia sp.]|jgi:hypothetical protein|uniref:hypothetical protein n=1 Tax=uncultured Rothia sp. TaxID=316088 RepID=UPI00206F8D6C|nr:hypothetical protein [uncultured Rothia sp.]DAX31151.1 MAG TPA: hypothetical protein [Caudoviricetes sp.]